MTRRSAEKRLSHTDGVVVSEDHRGGITNQCSLDDLTGIDGSAVNGAAKHFLELDNLMLGVQVDGAEYFMLAAGEFEGKKIDSGNGGAECFAVDQAATIDVRCLGNDLVFFDGVHSVFLSGFALTVVAGLDCHHRANGPIGLGRYSTFTITIQKPQTIQRSLS